MTPFSFEAFAYVGAFVAGYFLLPHLANFTRAVATALTKWSRK